MHNLNRRSFLKVSSILGTIGLEASQYFQAPISSIDNNNWDSIAQQFPITRWDRVNLNSGSAGTMSRSTAKLYLDLIRELNTNPPYHLWAEYQELRYNILLRLASALSISPQNISFVRNSTEAINYIIQSIELPEGSEILTFETIYPYARNAWRHTCLKKQWKLVQIPLQYPIDNGAVIDRLEQYRSTHTRMIHISHITSHEGHIMPVAAIHNWAKQHNIKVLVDGAQSFGHIPVNLNKLDVDYYVTSLHKWLNAPLGTGLIYIKSDSDIAEALPISTPSTYQRNADISGFDHTGLRAFANEIAVLSAIEELESIGIEEKQNRLQALSNYWTQPFLNHPKIKFITNLHTMDYAGMVTFSIDGMSAKDIYQYLYHEYRLHTKYLSASWGEGIRVSTNIYVLESAMDKLQAALVKLLS